VVHGSSLGLGIYLALEPTTALRYVCGSGPNLIVCLVLLGGRFVTSHHGSVLVVSNVNQVLPMFGFEVGSALVAPRFP
jgi:hypothetical protein